MDWLKQLFGTEKPVIAMCHLKPLPGDPKFDRQAGVEGVVEAARRDLKALQNGGVDAVMFSNEQSLPYLTKVHTITTATMARIVAELYGELTVPFGVNVLWDPISSIDLAVATGARFVREIFTGVYASDFGTWDTNCGEVVRHQHAVGGEDVKLLFNIVPEAAVYMAPRKLQDIARSTVFNAEPDGLCVSGLTAGAETSGEDLKVVKEAVPGTPVFANTGVRRSNVVEQLSVADGAIVATTFKRDGYIWNEVEEARVSEFMAEARKARG